MESYLPFIERHYVLVDSPHDGRPLWDYRTGRRLEVDRAKLRGTGGSIEAEPISALGSKKKRLCSESVLFISWDDEQFSCCHQSRCRTITPTNIFSARHWTWLGVESV